MSETKIERTKRQLTAKKVPAKTIAQILNEVAKELKAAENIATAPPERSAPAPADTDTDPDTDSLTESQS